MPSAQSMLQPAVCWVAGCKVVAVQACRVNMLLTHPAAYWYKWVRKRTKVNRSKYFGRKESGERGHVVMTKVVWSKYFDGLCFRWSSENEMW